MPKAEQPDINMKVMPVMVKELPPIAPRYDWVQIAERLRSTPMEWWKLFEQGRVSVINALRQGRISEMHPDLGFEFYTANNQRQAPRLADLYIRYNPEKESDIRAAIRAAKKAVK